MEYNINLGGWGSIFAVPSQVVDNDIKIASSYQLKVLLYILRNSGDELSDESIGKALNMHPSDVKDSVMFWCQRGLIVKNADDAASDGLLLPGGENDSSAAQVEDPSPTDSETASEPAVAQQPTVKRPISRPTRPEPAYVARRLATDNELVTLMDEAQRIFSRVLSNSDAATLVMLRDTDGLPTEVIIMLLQYCKSLDKCNMRTVERMGIQWASEGVLSLELAEQIILSGKRSSDAWNRIASVFGMRCVGSPTKKQLSFADCWVSTWGFSDEMLRLAYERCVDTKGEPNLTYINGILRRWHESGCKTVEDVDSDRPVQKNNAGKSGKSNSAPASYDIDSYEKKSIFDD